MGVDGILVSLSVKAVTGTFPGHSLAGMPIVYFDKVLSDTTTHKVVVPGHEAAIMAMRKLLDSFSGQKIFMAYLAIHGFDYRETVWKFTEALKKGIEEKRVIFTCSWIPKKQPAIWRLFIEAKPGPMVCNE
jgi:hypothetical protein